VKIGYVVDGVTHEVGTFRFNTMTDTQDATNAELAQVKMREMIERHAAGL